MVILILLLHDRYFHGLFLMTAKVQSQQLLSYYTYVAKPDSNGCFPLIYHLWLLSMVSVNCSSWPSLNGIQILLCLYIIGVQMMKVE